MWACSCGRRVPASVAACRCGATRPSDDSPSGAADFVQQRAAATATSEAAAPSSGEGGVYRGYVQIATVLLAVAVFFGSRACNKWRTSSQARAQLIEGLSPKLGADNAKRVAEAHHDACFESSYRMGGRRRASRFDDEAYVECVLSAVRKDPSSLRAPEASTPAATTVAAAPPVVTRVAPTAAPVAQATIRDVNVLTFVRETGVVELQFVASGASLAGLTCEYRVGCSSGGEGLGGTSACLSGAGGGDVAGSLSVLLGKSPGEGVCSVFVRLTGSEGPRSSWAKAILVDASK